MIPEFPAWIEIDTDAIKHNCRQMQELVGPQVRVMAVVKADAYGCGAVEVARAVAEAGAAMLGVTHCQEAVVLREAGLTAPILVFRPLLPWEVEMAATYRLTCTLASLDDMEVIAAAKNHLAGLQVHLKIETGLGRLGVRTGKELAEVGRRLRELPGVTLEGVYSHLATAAWGSRKFTYHQLRHFLEGVEQLAGLGFTGLTRHLAASAATVRFPEMRLDMVRIGSALYGQMPDRIRDTACPPLEPVWRARCRVIAVHDAPPGITVGYGRDYRVQRPTQLAVLPVGYADGMGMGPLPRPRGWVDLLKLVGKLVLTMVGCSPGGLAMSIAGHPSRVAGRIGMQLTVVDAGRWPDVKAGAVAEFPLRHLAASPYLPRVYLCRGRPYRVRLTALPGKQEVWPE